MVSKVSRDSVSCLFYEAKQAKQLDINDIPYVYPPEIYEFERLICELKYFAKVEEVRTRRENSAN